MYNFYFTVTNCLANATQRKVLAGHPVWERSIKAEKSAGRTKISWSHQTSSRGFCSAHAYLFIQVQDVRPGDAVTHIQVSSSLFRLNVSGNRLTETHGGVFP